MSTQPSILLFASIFHFLFPSSLPSPSLRYKKQTHGRRTIDTDAAWSTRSGRTPHGRYGRRT